MSSKPNETSEEREIKALVSRTLAKRPQNANLRRETLQRLIDATHSENDALKVYAATSIRLFIDVKELEEDAVNAVYDVCEDRSTAVRIKGYESIALISQSNKKLVKRNVDVLIQLLQSDDPDEVRVVSDQLEKHFIYDMHAAVSVFCDQINPANYSDDEQETRAYLRALVVGFLLDKKDVIVSHPKLTKDVEDMLVSNLVEALPDLTPPHSTAILSDLLLRLPSKNKVLDAILASASSTLSSPSPSGSSQKRATQLLSLAASSISSSALPLLQFYAGNIVGDKSVLAKLGPAEQVFVCSGAADALDACQNQQDVDAKVTGDLRAKLASATPHIIGAILNHRKSNTYNVNIPRALGIYLQNLSFELNLTTTPKWTPPADLASVLDRLSSSPEGRTLQNEISTILARLPTRPGPSLNTVTNAPSLSSRGSFSASTSVPSGRDAAPVKLKRTRDADVSMNGAGAARKRSRIGIDVDGDGDSNMDAERDVKSPGLLERMSGTSTPVSKPVQQQQRTGTRVMQTARRSTGDPEPRSRTIQTATKSTGPSGIRTIQAATGGRETGTRTWSIQSESEFKTTASWYKEPVDAEEERKRADEARARRDREIARAKEERERAEREEEMAGGFSIKGAAARGDVDVDKGRGGSGMSIRGSASFGGGGRKVSIGRGRGRGGAVGTSLLERMGSR